jgi:hypothetical protein
VWAWSSICPCMQRACIHAPCTTPVVHPASMSWLQTPCRGHAHALTDIMHALCNQQPLVPSCHQLLCPLFHPNHPIIVFIPAKSTSLTCPQQCMTLPHCRCAYLVLIPQSNTSAGPVCPQSRPHSLPSMVRDSLPPRHGPVSARPLPPMQWCAGPRSPPL